MIKNTVMGKICKRTELDCDTVELYLRKICIK